MARLRCTYRPVHTVGCFQMQSMHESTGMTPVPRTGPYLGRLKTMSVRPSDRSRGERLYTLDSRVEWSYSEWCLVLYTPPIFSARVAHQSFVQTPMACLGTQCSLDIHACLIMSPSKTIKTGL